MPQLLTFAVCEKSIVDKDDGSLSLMTLMSGITLQLSVSEVVDETAVIPLRISVVTMWLKTPDDEGKIFEQKVEILHSGGEAVGYGQNQFTLTKRTHTNRVNLVQYPMGMGGLHIVRLSLREVKDEQEIQWQEIAKYPLEVNIQRVEDANG